MNQLAPPADLAQSLPTKYHDVTVVHRKTYAKARVMGVPPEECGIEGDVLGFEEAVHRIDARR